MQYAIGKKEKELIRDRLKHLEPIPGDKMIAILEGETPKDEQHISMTLFNDVRVVYVEEKFPDKSFRYLFSNQVMQDYLLQIL